MGQLLRVQNFMVSSDGFGTGEGQSLERPFGHADPGEMFSWAGATASWPNRTAPGGSRGLDDYFTRDFSHNIGAEIMGRNKFGPQRGPWQDHEWQGWWGDEPPFHTPVFVMTHHPRPSFTLSDTTFHFVDADPAEVLARAKEEAKGKDVRLGGGATVIREFLDAGLVDTLHVAVAPVKLGAGVRLWESPDELLDRYHLADPGVLPVGHHLRPLALAEGAVVGEDRQDGARGGLQGVGTRRWRVPLDADDQGEDELGLLVAEIGVVAAHPASLPLPSRVILVGMSASGSGCPS